MATGVVKKGFPFVPIYTHSTTQGVDKSAIAACCKVGREVNQVASASTGPEGQTVTKTEREYRLCWEVQNLHFECVLCIAIIHHAPRGEQRQLVKELKHLEGSEERKSETVHDIRQMISKLRHAKSWHGAYAKLKLSTQSICLLACSNKKEVWVQSIRLMVSVTVCLRACGINST